MNTYQNCIEACMECIAACNHCVSSCLREKNVGDMAACISTDLECAAICAAAVSLMSMESKFVHETCKLCAGICNACAEECEKHTMDHCRKCAAVCRYCAEECRGIAEA
ncbi:four-helix bundle copper-binding protein [Agriterribacter sp.]|uniref:four-helix bundle copper-binding protein n=1 Tax=Agriterribacter sp. TaxID=2821509 RepID=UPI002C0587B3|nr:four-helix bundle copper-binding protein [Agriterribacter sp.]HRO45782.1 four-helix bundle copper-binding protein [Agriterribacter sp.]HRQ16763.1 four-helix bundle copper-binding protein [Agriterribacter sp.]